MTVLRRYNLFGTFYVVGYTCMYINISIERKFNNTALLCLGREALKRKLTSIKIHVCDQLSFIMSIHTLYMRFPKKKKKKTYEGFRPTCNLPILLSPKINYFEKIILYGRSNCALPPGFRNTQAISELIPICFPHGQIYMCIHQWWIKKFLMG